MECLVNEKSVMEEILWTDQVLKTLCLVQSAYQKSPHYLCGILKYPFVGPVVILDNKHLQTLGLISENILTSQAKSYEWYMKNN